MSLKDVVQKKGYRQDKISLAITSDLAICNFGIEQR